MHRTAHLLIAGLLVIGPACIHRGGTPLSTAKPEERDSLAFAMAVADPVVVEVTNNYEIPMEVYASGSGMFYRMGTVAQGMQGRFVLRAALVVGGMVELVAQPTGYGPLVRSGQLQIVPGDIVDFTIATMLTGSIATIRP